MRVTCATQQGFALPLTPNPLFDGAGEGFLAAQPAAASLDGAALTFPLASSRFRRPLLGPRVRFLLMLTTHACLQQGWDLPSIFSSLFLHSKG
jgi:hypothetical protein